MGSSDLVVPFRGERYRATDRLGALIAPPYDVISTEHRKRYAAADPHNIVHVMLPEVAPGGPTDKYAAAAARLAAWRADGVLARDAEPAVYVLAQDFALPSGERRTRVGVFAAVAAEGYGPRRIRPHERTHAGPKADRLALLRATATNIESIFLIAPDPDRRLATALRAVTAAPPAATAELDGVGIRLWVVGGGGATEITALCAPRPLYIADGHHRYETATAYAGENPAASHLLALIVSAGDAGLSVLPTHRVIFGAANDPAKRVALWERWFTVTRLEPGSDRQAWLARASATACVVAWAGGPDLGLTLKPDAPLDTISDLGATPAVRALDVARIETLVVKEIVRAGTTTVTIDYSADAAQALAKVRPGGATVAVLVNPTKVEQVFAVADAGDVMPPKSTYFIPKVPSGLVLRSST